VECSQRPPDPDPFNVCLVATYCQHLIRIQCVPCCDLLSTLASLSLLASTIPTPKHQHLHHTNNIHCTHPCRPPHPEGGWLRRVSYSYTLHTHYIRTTYRPPHPEGRWLRRVSYSYTLHTHYIQTSSS
jgi:hypothetical protein